MPSFSARLTGLCDQADEPTETQSSPVLQLSQMLTLYLGIESADGYSKFGIPDARALLTLCVQVRDLSALSI